MNYFRERINYNPQFLLCCLICLIPFALVTGPFFPDLLLSLSAIIFFVFTIISKELKYYKLKIVIIFFFWYFYLVFNSLLSSYPFLSLESSLFYLRFIVFSLAVYFTLKKFPKFINYFTIVLIIVFSFLIIDGLREFITSSYDQPMLKILYNVRSTAGRVSSLFGEELILGSFLSRLLPLLLGLILLIKLGQNKCYYIYFVIFFLTSLTVFLSGERSAFSYICLLTIFLILFKSNIRKYIFYSLIMLGLSIYCISLLKFEYTNRMIKQTIDQINFKDNKTLIFSIQHQVVFKSSFKIFEDNIYFGIGPKNFREVCKNKKYQVNTDLDRSIDGCQTHPHNTYLQLATETGLFGLVFGISTFLFVVGKLIIIIINSYKKSYSKILEFKFYCYVSFFITLWPLVPTGNLFNNWLNVIYFLPLGFTLYIERIILDEK